MVKTKLDRNYMTQEMRDALGDRGALYGPNPQITSLAAMKMIDTEGKFPGEEERAAFHQELRAWASGPLVVEKPNGSRFHHMVEYDRQHFGELASRKLNDPQVFVIEHDWAATVPPSDGEWRLPFPLTAWELQVSGVRIVAIVDSDENGLNPMLVLIYGKHKTWVIDDYRFEATGTGSLFPKKNDPHQPNPQMFQRSVQFAWDSIRACCIMIDAQVARHEKVLAPRALIDSRARSGKSKPKDYLVVRLLHRHVRHTSGNYFGSSGDRSPQRGHWRKGTWVHYDDPDSGQVQYANDGGFVVSKTWRRWHFAGDPNNLIRKEYRI